MKDLEITQLDKARGKIDRLGDKIGELTPFNTFYLSLRRARTSIVVSKKSPMLPLDLCPQVIPCKR